MHTFSWQCDFVIVACDSSGNVVRRIDFSEITTQHPNEKIVRGQKATDKHSIFMYDNGGSVSIATQEEILKSVEKYFQTHDLASFNLYDLWWEVMCDHLCGYSCPMD